MRLLLDTHVILWAMARSPALPAHMADAISDPDAELWISAVSVWEVSIKKALGKLPAPADLWDRARDAGCAPLPITWAHARAVESLPLHHTDPFDRLLIAQARLEGLTLVTADRAFAAYDVQLL